MNGSATVRNTTAAGSADGSGAISTVPPSGPWAASFWEEAGGASHTSPFRSWSMPLSSSASPQNTGSTEPAFTPRLMPRMTSSGVNCSPEKYFSNMASSVSATAS